MLCSIAIFLIDSMVSPDESSAYSRKYLLSYGQLNISGRITMSAPLPQAFSIIWQAFSIFARLSKLTLICTSPSFILYLPKSYDNLVFAFFANTMQHHEQIFNFNLILTFNIVCYVNEIHNKLLIVDIKNFSANITLEMDMEFFPAEYFQLIISVFAYCNLFYDLVFLKYVYSPVYRWKTYSFGFDQFINILRFQMFVAT